jgi:hypothetical protein
MVDYSPAPDLIEPVHAWRVWSVRETEHGWRLASIHYRESWEPQAHAAAWCYRSSSASEVHHDRHVAPVAGCHCGIYGAAEAADAGEYLGQRQGPWESMYVAAEYRHRVLGQVALWGRTVECTGGFRASFAYPTRLWLPTRRPDGREIDTASLEEDLAAYGVALELVDAGTREDILALVA